MRRLWRVEDRSPVPDQRRGRRQPGRGEGLIERVVLAIDVEVAERDQVLIPAELPLRPGREPVRDRLQLGDAIGSLFAVVDVQGDEDERLPRG